LYKEISQTLDSEDIDRQVQCLNQIASLQDRLGYTEEAKNYWLQCLEMLQDDFHNDIGVIYGGLGWLKFREGDQEEAMDYCAKGLKLLEHSDISSQKAYLLNTMGTMYFYQGEIDQALKTWRKALKIRQHLGHKKGISDLHNNIGAALSALGRYKGAKWHWNRCLEISQQIGNIERMAGIYNNLGVQAYERGKLQEADRYYQQACDIFNRLGARRDIASLLNNLGEVSLQRADYLKAMEYWQQALEIGKELADQESQIEPLYQLGHLYMLLGDYQKAEERLTESETLANNISASASLGSIYELLARLSLQSGKIEQAKQYCEKSLEQLVRSGNQVKLARGWVTQAQIAVALNDEDMMNTSLKEANKLSKETGELHLLVTSALCTLNFYIDARADKTQSKDIVSSLKEVLEKGSVFPELLWQAHWMKGRYLKNQGQWKAALDSYSQAVSILKRISKKLSQSHQSKYLQGPVHQKFRQEAIEIKKLAKGDT
jgi:tetratricopeptide (TPR) repeat protein